MTTSQQRRSTSALFAYFAREYPRRTILMLGSQVAAGLAESISIVSLLPLFAMMGSGSTIGTQSRLATGILDALSTFGLQPTLASVLGILVLGMLLRSIFMLLAMREVGYTVAHVATDLRLNLVRALLGARWSYFTAQPTGKLSNAFGSEAERAAMAYYALCQILALAIQVALYLILAFVMSWLVALAAIVAGVVLVGSLGWLIKIGRRAGEQQTRLLSSLVARLIDALRGIKPLKAMGRESGIGPLLEAETRQLNDTLRRQVLTREAINSLQEPILILFLAGGLYAGIEHFGQTLPSMILLALVFQRVTTRVGSIQRLQHNLSVTESAFWAMRDAIETAREARENHDGIGTPHVEHLIQVRDLCFDYEQKTVLHSISLDIRVNRVTTLLGPSGSGKSTLVDLLMGLHNPKSGGILIDGIPLEKLDIALWRDRIGYVPQETFIFNDTVYNNITLGDDRIAREEVERALRQAGAWSFVAALPGGLEEKVGEAGMKLSGGQRQRLAIARAIVRRPLLLILDEATSALDPDTEMEICQTIRSLACQTTVVAISHQAGLAEIADDLYQISEGRAILTSAGVERKP